MSVHKIQVMSNYELIPGANIKLCEDLAVMWIIFEPCHLLSCCHRYRNKDDFDEQHCSQDVPGDRFRGDPRKSLPHEDIWHSGPVVVEHDHGIAHGRETSQWEQFDGHREQEAGFGQQRSPRRPSQDHLRLSDSRYVDREDGRGGHLRDDRGEADYHDTKNPSQQARPNTRRYGDHRERIGRFSHGRGERIGPYRNPLRLQQSSLGYQDPLQEEQRPEYRPLREEDYENPSEGQIGWAEESRSQNWRRNIDLDPKMPHQRMDGWNDRKTKNMAVLTEETLTIKVDMSRPVNNNRWSTIKFKFSIFFQSPKIRGERWKFTLLLLSLLSTAARRGPNLLCLHCIVLQFHHGSMEALHHHDIWQKSFPQCTAAFSFKSHVALTWTQSVVTPTINFLNKVHN